MVAIVRSLPFLFSLVALTCGQSLGGPKVKVDLYYEVGCPFCLKFITTVLPELLQSPGMLENVVDFEGHPFGNAYFVTPECGGGGAYKMNARLCWEKMCGFPLLAAAPSHCFDGELVCQHGEAECKLNRAAACAKAVSNDPRIYMPFSGCMGAGAGVAANTHTELDLAKTCAATSNLAWEQTSQCYVSSGVLSGAALIRQASRETPVHPAVPYVTVNGIAIADHDEMFAEVCKAWKGIPLNACAQYLTPPVARKLTETDTIV